MTTDAPIAASSGLLEFTCPRCDAAVAEGYYGPCRRCRDDLAASLGGPARDVEVAPYEPKMNVTPNNVASKEE